MASNQRHTEFPPDPKYSMLFLAIEYTLRPSPPFSRLIRPHSATDCVVKLIFFINHYHERVGRTNKTPRQFALRVNKHVSHRI